MFSTFCFFNYYFKTLHGMFYTLTLESAPVLGRNRTFTAFIYNNLKKCYGIPVYLSRSSLLCQENQIPLQSSSYNYKIHQYHSISAFIYKFKILKLFYITDTVHGSVLYEIYSCSSWSVHCTCMNHPHNTKAKS